MDGVQTHSRIFSGASIAWTFRYAHKAGEHFVEHIATPGANESELLKFSWLDGKDHDLSLPLLYDITPFNMENKWRESILASCEAQTCLKSTIKPEFMYKVTQELHLPELEDVFIAMKYALREHKLISSLTTHLNSSTYAETLEYSSLSPRSFVNDEISNPYSKMMLRSAYLEGFTRSSAGTSLKVLDVCNNYTFTITPR